VGDTVTLLSRILFGATIATLVLGLVSYTVYSLREERHPRRRRQDWALPDEADGTLRPILFERLDLDEIDAPGPRE